MLKPWGCTILCLLLLFSHSLSRVWLCDPTDWSTPGFPVLHHLPELAHSFLLRQWCYSTILCLLNKTLSCKQAVTLAHCFKSLLQWDWTEEITHCPHRINKFLFFRPPSLWYIVIVAYHSASSSNMCSFPLHTTKQFSDTIYICRVSYSFTQFWRCLPRDSIRLHR